MAVEIDSVEARNLPPVRDGMVAVYRDVFAIPPYAESEEDTGMFASRLPRHAANDGFRCAVARDDGRVVGFGYGYASRPGQWWHDVVRAGLGPATAERWLTGAFELAQLAVLPASQGRGVGGRLHDRILGGCPSSTAVATTLERDNPAVAFYRRHGWEILLTGFRYPGVAEPYVVIGRNLRPTAGDGDR